VLERHGSACNKMAPMDPAHLCIDERLVGMCVHCGAEPSTRDHVPSKVLLDEPYPPDLPVLNACADCNAGCSLDEQYLSCFIECVVCGTAVPANLRRAKIQRVLTEQTKLQNRIASSMRIGLDDTPLWEPEFERVLNVVLKLARGHAAYELYPKFENPDHISVFPLSALDDRERQTFEGGDGNVVEPWPEIGSRAFMRASGAKPDLFPQIGDWIIVQPDRYRYAVKESGGISVRIVLSEYLGCEVSWE
jgi:hypothetical protein